VKKRPKFFLRSLTDKVYKDLYQYDSNRLKRFAKTIALRLEKNEAGALIVYLNSPLFRIIELPNE
tara:strand:- start:771 stop:965 length:195 start_codon:yes stop_codon:yes gene_type:complete